MQEKTDYLKDISEIRSMMERSSRFISLSGLSGVLAGIYALLGAYLASLVLYRPDILQQLTGIQINVQYALFWLFGIAFLILILAIGTGILLTTKRAKNQGLKVWDTTVRRLMINLMIPLVAGGIFSLILVYRGFGMMVAPVTMIFYGLALVNASKYTLTDIRYLGLAEIAVGLLAAGIGKYYLLCWAIGFGVLHIVYGTIMYFKYEK